MLNASVQGSTTNETTLKISQVFSHRHFRLNLSGSIQSPAITPATRIKAIPSQDECRTLSAPASQPHIRRCSRLLRWLVGATIHLRGKDKMPLQMGNVLKKVHFMI
jgi:hypothetical protein